MDWPAPGQPVGNGKDILMKHNSLLLLCLGVLTISGLVAVDGAQAAVLNVPGDYAQINAAVQACAAGDTVLVAAGTWSVGPLGASSLVWGSW